MKYSHPFFIGLGVCLVCDVASTGSLRAADKPASVAKEQNANGSILLRARDVKIEGAYGRLEGKGERCISWWTDVRTSLRWTANIPKAGKYRVELDYALEGDSVGGPLGIAVGEQMIKARPKPAQGRDDFHVGTAGELAIDQPGNVQVVFKALPNSRACVIRLRSVVLVPAERPGGAVDISDAPIEESADGTIRLSADEAAISGLAARLEGDGEKNIGSWQDIGTTLGWSIRVRNPGKFRVEMNYALGTDGEGSKVAITVDGQTIKAKPKTGDTWTNYQTGRAGEVTLGKAGDYSVVIKPLSKPPGNLLNLRSITLAPAETPGEAPDIADVPIKAGADGAFALDATNAEVDGEAVRREEGKEGEAGYLVWWDSLDRVIQWPVTVEKAGVYTVEFTYALSGAESRELEFSVGPQRMTVKVQGGATLDEIKTEKMGEISIAKPGDLEVSLRSTNAPGGFVMHLRSVKLTPAEKSSEAADSK